MIQAGRFIAHAHVAKLGTTETGKDQIGVQFRLDEGPDEGELVSWYGYFTDKAVQRTLESLRHCGFVGYDLNVFDGTPEATSRLLPRSVELDIEIEEYEGKSRPKVRWVNAAGGMPFVKKEMDAARRAAFASAMKGTLMALETNGSNLEDVPFR